MRTHLTVSLVFILASCSARAQMPSMVPDPASPSPQVSVTVPTGKQAIDSILDELTVEQMVGQLVFPWLLGDYASFDQPVFDRTSDLVEKSEVGGILISIGSPLDVASKLNELQRRSRLPLLVAADLEWGSAMRLVGGTAFPYPMALGATDRELDAYQMARVTALEARAVGIHMTFSPVADLNNNSANPIINTRSFGEDAESVSRLISAYISGAEENGLYTTAKHFPGHGDTGTDSHIDVPVASACWDRLDTLELAPFRAAIEAGVTAVMTAHIALPCFHPDDEQLPATLSETFMTDVLRDSLGFEGLVVTDALIMGAIVNRYGTEEAVIRAFLAGSDLLLMPTNIPEAIEAMVNAVESGRIGRERLRESTRRVLELKFDAGLFESRTVSLDRLPSAVGTQDFIAIADDIAARAITLVEEGPIREFRADTGSWALITYAEETNLNVGNVLLGELRTADNTVSSFRLYPSSGPMSYDSARTIMSRNDRILFASSVRPIAWRGHIALPDSLARTIEIVSKVKPTVLASLGSPYLLNQLAEFEGGFLLAWSATPASEKAVAAAVTGAIPISGRSPIRLSDEYPRGHGIQISGQ